MTALQNLHAALELLGLLLLDPRRGVLLALLAAAMWTDLRRQRIPNRLVAVGLVYALVFNALHPGHVSGGVGLSQALAGMLLGFALTVPFYLMRGMAAGDVKLMAMCGAFLGPWDGLHAVLWSFIAGGVLVVGWAVVRGRAMQLVRNVVQLLAGASLQLAAGRVPGAAAVPASVGSLPYGIAIAAGTAAFVVARQLGLVDYV
ncbi:type IV leader peptidase family protein [mine drainage metagenome]|uniref:Type IV leader peptidase family protein n=1 Tax=mine drainage metagenome TaxID=410659 RepID=A0A1J5R5K7_9ZZZZ